MPLPSPSKDEDEKTFMSRCMGHPHMNDKFPDNAQRAAVCYKQYRGVSKSSAMETRVNFKKFAADRQIAYGEVYVPYVPDSQGDFMSPEEIERIAHNFLKRGKVNSIDTEHNLMKNGSVVVESFIARDGDTDFIPGSWVLGIHIPDGRIWEMTKSGELGGFSMYGSGRREPRVVEIEVPDDGILFGKTAESGPSGIHRHVFGIEFDEQGNFLGGETSEADGHTHKIKKGTVTEPAADGHRHRFHFVDALLKSEEDYSADESAWIEDYRQRVHPVAKAEGGNPYHDRKGRFSSANEDADGAVPPRKLKGRLPSDLGATLRTQMISYMEGFWKKIKDRNERMYCAKRSEQMVLGEPRIEGMSKLYGIDRTRVPALESVIYKVFKAGRVKLHV